MSENPVSRGETIKLTVAGATKTAGLPYRISSINGVAYNTALVGEVLTFQIQGAFVFTLASVTVGALIYITTSNALALTSSGNIIFGRAITATAGGTFECLILQPQIVDGA